MKIDIDRFICYLIESSRKDGLYLDLNDALEYQGLTYRNGEIVEIDQPPLTEEQKAKFNKERLMEIAKPESIEEKYDIDIEKMVEDYKEEESKVLLPLGFSKGNIEHLSIAYKNGLEDMLKLIKGRDKG